MTRLPVESWDVKAITGELFPKYKVPPMCAHPACSKWADHAHHIVRRSFIIGDVSWVQFGDGPIVGNLCGLCYSHHDAITVNQGHIAWESRLKQYTWIDTDGYSLGRLNPHPPLHASPEPEEDHVHIEAPGSNVCPGCKRPISRPKEAGEKREAAKRRKTWSVTVPDEGDEDGAQVLDTLVDICAELFGREPGGKLRYYVLTQALALVVQNGHTFSK